jgi:hypothetical protein
MKAMQVLPTRTIAAHSTTILRIDQHFMTLYRKEMFLLFSRIYPLAIKNTGTAKLQI